MTRVNWRSLFYISIPVTVLVTALSFKPVSIAIFKITEPYFNCPVKIEKNALAIRNDAMGEGEFGAKRSKGRLHTGLDICAPLGTPVYASKSGLAFCGNVPTGYGKYVMIYHPDDSQTMYGHLSNWAVSSTQTVRRGELIGFVGKTGNAAGKSIAPHLHFEIKKNGKPQDPMALMK